MTLLVLGVGNEFFGDDGAGIAAVRRAQARYNGKGVTFAEASGGGLELLDRMVGHPAVLIVDAAVTGMAPPGTVLLLSPESLPAGVSDAHGAGLGTALAIGRRMGLALPERLDVLAIEALSMDEPGAGLSPPLANSLEDAVAAILAMIRSGALCGTGLAEHPHHGQGDQASGQRRQELRPAQGHAHGRRQLQEQPHGRIQRQELDDRRRRHGE